MSHITWETNKRVCIVTLNRPDKYNSFDLKMVEAFEGFLQARRYDDEIGVIIIHGGEAKGPESVWEILEHFKPRRIGHGVRSIEDPKLVEHLAANNIHLEVCPTCNVQINIFETHADHPIDKLMKAGISLGVNTDGRSLSEISLSKEYAKLAESFGWGIDEFYQVNLNALEHAFIPAGEKVGLKEVLKNGYRGMKAVK